MLPESQELPGPKREKHVKTYRLAFTYCPHAIAMHKAACTSSATGIQAKIDPQAAESDDEDPGHGRSSGQLMEAPHMAQQRNATRIIQ